MHKGFWKVLVKRADLSFLKLFKPCSKYFVEVTRSWSLSSKLRPVRSWEADPGCGAGSWGSSLLPSRIHPSGQLPTGRTLAAHHHLLVPEEQLGGPAAEGKTLWRPERLQRINMRATWTAEGSVRRSKPIWFYLFKIFSDLQHKLFDRLFRKLQRFRKPFNMHIWLIWLINAYFQCA